MNSGVPLTRQQMRNCLYMGRATAFLKEEARTEIFLEATDKGLKQQTMRDREFVNRFCAFQLLGLDGYRGDMDEFLAKCLRRMNNEMKDDEISRLSTEFRRSLANNFALFGRHAFRKHGPGQDRQSVINAALWDVMATGLSRYDEYRIGACAESLRQAASSLLADESFNTAITHSSNDTRKVKARFRMVHDMLGEVLGAHSN